MKLPQTSARSSIQGPRTIGPDFYNTHNPSMVGSIQPEASLACIESCIGGYVGKCLACGSDPGCWRRCTGSLRIANCIENRCSVKSLIL